MSTKRVLHRAFSVTPLMYKILWGMIHDELLLTRKIILKTFEMVILLVIQAV